MITVYFNPDTYGKDVPYMADIDPTRSFSDIAQRTGKATPYWERANEIVTRYSSYLSLQREDESTYLVTPPVTHKCGDSKLTFAIAGLMSGKTLTSSRFLVINNDFSNLVMFQRYGDDPLAHFKTNETVVDDNLDAVLRKIASAVESQEARAKDKRDKRDSQVANAIGILVMGAICLGIAALLIWGFIAFIRFLDAPKREAEQKIAAFDQQYPNLVIQGKRFDINTSDTLTSSAPDMAKDIPGTSDQSIGIHARSFTVSTGQCADSQRRDEVGRITGDQYLVAQSNAPDGIIKIAVDKVGSVSVCADDPEDLGNAGPKYTVLLQVQPKK